MSRSVALGISVTSLLCVSAFVILMGAPIECYMGIFLLLLVVIVAWLPSPEPISREGTGDSLTNSAAATLEEAEAGDEPSMTQAIGAGLLTLAAFALIAFVIILQIALTLSQ